MSKKIYIHSTRDQQHKCHFCGKFANYSLYLAGTVRESGKPDQGIPGVRVVAKEVRMTADTDDQGQYSFTRLSAGEHTFQVIVSGKMVKETSITVPSASYDLEV